MTITPLKKFFVIFSAWALMLGSTVLLMPATRVAAADCDANAVIYCGVTDESSLINKYRQNQGGNLHAIYAHFGMPDESFLTGMTIGRVTKAGEVFVGDELVATNAATAGRQDMKGSTKIPGIQAYKRRPSVSFRSQSLPALVRMVDGKFHAAVIMSCGNPVSATPVYKPAPSPMPVPRPEPKPKHPSLSIQKDVRLKGTSTWQQEVSAQPGDELEYLIRIKNTGDTPLTNLIIRDILPSDVSFSGNKLRGSFFMQGNSLSDLTGSGARLDTLSIGSSLELIFTVQVGNAVDACDTPLINIATVASEEVRETSDNALARVCAEEEPSVEPVVVKPVKRPPVESSPSLPSTGVVGVAGAFSIVSVMGVITHKLKEFYKYLLR
ncbi:DUF11 domain-containing protein [Candidatus Saccharibacteria bacterium]|nr:DUF11 domain-containing protein [Candidatus Saccharibacteria bacterium]